MNAVRQPAESNKSLGTLRWVRPESVSGFFKVQLPDGKQGFVSQDFTKLVDSATFAPAAETSAPIANLTDLDSETLQIHFINVGQGDGNLIICPNGNTIIIDSGTTADGSVEDVRAYISDVTEPYGHQIDYLIVTHPDTDHYNFLAEALADIPIGRAYYVGVEDDYRFKSDFTWIRNTPASVEKLTSNYFDPADRPNPEIDCGTANVWILAAAIKSSHSPKNALSIVTMIQYGEFEAIMTGDATFATEKAIMDRYPAEFLQAELLKVGHHGSDATSTDQRWAETVKPQIAVVSAGYESTHGHPRLEVVERLTPYTISVEPHWFHWATRVPGQGRKYNYHEKTDETEGIYNTAVNGNIAVITDGETYEVHLAQGE